ncbi:hypothetical protein BDW62DRAFT_183193 [Aspergillus aurantiobrunneus]
MLQKMTAIIWCTGIARGDPGGQGVLHKTEFSTDWKGFLSEPPAILRLMTSDRKDDYRSMLTYVVQMRHMQIAENNPRAWLTIILTVCILAPLHQFWIGWKTGTYFSCGAWETMTEHLCGAFRSLCQAHSNSIE